MTYANAVHRQPLTFDEYLEFEAHSPWKHELVDGESHAFAGSSEEHSRVVARIVAMFDGPASTASGRLFGPGMKLRVSDATVYFPDVMLVCNPDDRERYFKTSPCLVVEVLSPSTAATDRREKRLAYHLLPSLRDYLVVSQDRREVDHHYRDGDGVWRVLTATGSAILHLTCLDIELPLDQVFAGILPT
jgi:Uma2 family endonuclease